MKRALLAAMVIVTLTAVLAAGLVSAQTPRRGGTLRVGLNADSPNMDPYQSTAAVDRQVFQSLFGDAPAPRLVEPLAAG